MLFPVSCHLSATGVRFLVILCPLGDWASLTVGLPAPVARRRTPTGLPRSAHMRHDRRGRPLYPGDGGAHNDRRVLSGRRLPRHSGKSLHPGPAPIIRGLH